MKRDAAKKRQLKRNAAILTAAALLSGCAADYEGRPPAETGNTTNPLEQERQLSAAATSAQVSFHFADFYSLMAPNGSTGCAGDAKIYHQPFVSDPLSGSKPYPTSSLDPTATIKPDFIKNIAVDLTDANSALASNRAGGCSYGTGLGLPSPTSCATFDYGAAGGVASSLGGSLLLLGGIHSYNYASPPLGLGHAASCGIVNAGTPNTCSISSLALALETLPASAATDPPSELAPGLIEAEAPISSWVNLAGSINYTGPEGLAGAGAAFDSVGRKFLLFGGSSAFTVGNTTLGRTSSGSWLLDLGTQEWKHVPALGNSTVDQKILRLLDGSTYLQKTSEARMLFGYVAAQGMAFDKMRNSLVIDSGNVDRTDRIVITGGVGAAGVLTDTRRFNPTYGPDWVDRYDTAGQTQWLDSYHTQLMSNSSTLTSHFKPDYPPTGGPESANLAVSFGAVALRDNTGERGYVLTAGGFESTSTVNTPSDTCDDLTKCGVISIAKKTEASKTGFISLPNTLAGVTARPIEWSEIPENGVTLPWYGGVSLLPGFDLSLNEIVYFGGTSCRTFLTANPAGCSFNNPGRYWRLGTNPDPATLVDTSGVDVAFNGTPPKYAGMASARGLDPADNVIVVAWGGAQAAKTSAPSNKLFIMHNSGGTPTWIEVTLSGGPTGLANASMVFSHVTRKFYLFGGYSPTLNYLSGDTWQLEFLSTGACVSSATCTFKWTQLNADARFSCYPNCPSARHSQRMVEANYYNHNPGGIGARTDGESVCSDEEPCSFGIFMEGGNQSGAGTDLAADRWMFDPTANGLGQWIRMGELPPRVLPGMAGLEYKLPDGNTIVRRALLFGGETGMQSPASTASGYFVAPTLGDTLMFDFETSQWNRVELLGKGYNTGQPTTPARDKRESFNAADPVENNTNDLSVLSPPPLSGTVMVTRTHQLSAGVPTKLNLPEVYLLGGREKDGTPHALDRVYKFCAGTTGEMTELNDARCDFFDSSTNSGLLVPTSKYEGRWLLKRPAGAPGKHSFLGAASYDSVRDKIVLVGGITFADHDTDGAISVIQSGGRSGSSSVFEYTSATRVRSATPSEINGSWAQIPVCGAMAVPPDPRYGHSLSYDPTKRRLIMVGGYGIDGTPLTWNVNDWSGSYTAPEIWAGQRIDVNVAENEIPGVPEVTDAPCYYWTPIKVFGNTRFGDPTQTPPQYGIAHAASLFLPSAGYNTGYYTMFDNACEYQGPISSTEPSINKLLAGGAYIDIDRSKLGPSENVLLNLTYIPLGTSNLRPDSLQFSAGESAVFKVHLVKTGQSVESLMQVFQPRYFTYTASDTFPEVAHTISVLAPPTGQVRQEQILIPLTLDPAIDRIRIERYSGSGILIDMSLFRMGYR